MNPPGLIEAVHRLEEIFDRLKIDRSYGGAIALNYYAPPRFTQDIHLLLLIPDLKLPKVVEDLSAAGCKHAPNDADGLVLTRMLGELRSKPYFSTIYIDGIRTEMFTPWHTFHHRVLERSPRRELEERQIRIHSPEDLIVFKKIFDRPKDIGDIKAMLLTQKGRLDLDRLRADAKTLLRPESFQELSGLISQFG